MSRDRGYLQTITCNISLSSCRLRAESLARSLNDKWWSTRGLTASQHRTGKVCETYLAINSGGKATSTSCMAHVANQPSGTQMETFDGNLDKMVNHGWVNAMAADESEDSYDTPPCSSPPSPADNDVDIIVNPPTFNVHSLPFSTKFIRDLKSDDAFSNGVKLREKLRQYADDLLSATDDGVDTFYDASEDSRSVDYNHSNNCEELSGDCQDTKCISTESIADTIISDILRNGTSEESLQKKESSFDNICFENDVVFNATPKINGEVEVSSNILIEVQPPTPSVQSPADDPEHCSHNLEDQPEQCPLRADNPHLLKIKELEEEDRPKLIRTTSLKTGKTPPGTPGRKKIVRFADVLGLDLEAVRHIITDDLPNVPLSAYNDLKLPPVDPSPIKSPSVQPRQQSFGDGPWNAGPLVVSGSPLTGLFPLFDVPASDPCFLNRVRTEWVSLERVTVSDLNVHGVCCVLNVFFEKTVIARYTTDEWQTYSEVVASYVPYSSDGEFDRFSFSLFLQPNQKRANQRLCFAILYKTKGTERWDNNRGQNYVLRFHGTDDSTSSLLLPTLEGGGPSWLDHFY